MIAIIGAMDSEIEALLQQLKLQKTVTFADKVLYLGVLRGHDVLIAKSGIGKVNTAMMTTYVLSHYKIDFLINIGVAGGVFGVEVGDLLLAEGICYFDVSLTEIGDYPYGKMGDDPLIVYPDPGLLEKARKVFAFNKLNYQSGIIASGDSFVTALEQIRKISEVVEGIKACEMEGMAIGICCHKLNVPFLSIRGISDLIQKPGQKATYKKSMKDVAAMTAGAVLFFLESYRR